MLFSSFVDGIAMICAQFNKYSNNASYYILLIIYTTSHNILDTLLHIFPSRTCIPILTVPSNTHPLSRQPIFIHWDVYGEKYDMCEVSYSFTFSFFSLSLDSYIPQHIHIFHSDPFCVFFDPTYPRVG